ncbi:aminoglycoside 3'-phosphotransferase [Saccharothrix obliqua]|uniref:aminoglycoside 3'-phosphotransferase n=1 Tax=Saccharothrix obliqua TaxID=2861747 RepID=UPI001C5EAB5C|nr:aminoglycoside 3'-phosphotransferase [Saccharothrix obliqua]MBW4720520.1 aminoglycoside 3'-phosphotransferase [Saccharothrix obliqua]
MHAWEPVTTGHSAASVHRSPDGRAFAKTATAPHARDELRAERDRLQWLDSVGVAAPRVLDWSDDGASTLVTSALPGVPASDLPRTSVRLAAERLVAFLASLHALPVADCPFDRRLAVVVGVAAERVSAGLVDEDTPRGRSAVDLLGELESGRARAEAAERADLAVCHGDFCLPNVLLDPDRLAVTGILDVGRLGVADRHVDLALLTRSMATTELNPAYGPDIAEWVAERTGADPWRIGYYRLLDEFC